MDSPPADQDVQTVIELELRLLRPEVRAEPGEVEALLHPGFIWLRTPGGWRVYFHQGTLVRG
jgi:hypothetical protein